MVKILESLPAAVQVAQAASNVTKTAQVAQQALFRTAAGTQLTLDQLTKGPLLPRIVELRNLREVSERLFDMPESKILSAVADFRVDKLVNELSPAEVVQMAFRREFHDLPENLDLSTLLRATGLEGADASYGDLIDAPLYPSIQERITWEKLSLHFFKKEESTLAHFCRKKGQLLADQMSEAETVQYALVVSGQRPYPRLTPSRPEQFADANGQTWTLAQLKERPLTDAVQTLRKLEEAREASDHCCGTVASAAEARLVVERWEAARQTRRLLHSLSDAELLQLVMS